MAPLPTPTGRQGSTLLIHPGQRKNNQQTTRARPYPEQLFPRILRHPWRKKTPRDHHTALSCKTKLNTNRFRGTKANLTPRLRGQNNTAPGYKDQGQQPARATKLLTKVDGEEQYIKITAPGLTEDGATGTLALDAGTQLGEAQDKFTN